MAVGGESAKKRIAQICKDEKISWPVILRDKVQKSGLKSSLFARWVLIDTSGVVRFVHQPGGPVERFSFEAVFMRELETLLKEMGHDIQIVNPEQDSDSSNSFDRYAYTCSKRLIRQVISGGKLADDFLEESIPKRFHPVIRSEIFTRLKYARALTAVQLNLPEALGYLKEVVYLTNGEQLNKLAAALLEFSEGFELDSELAEAALAIAQKGVQLNPTDTSINNYAKCLVEFEDNFDDAIIAQYQAIRLSQEKLESLMADEEKNKWSIKSMEEQISNFESYHDQLKQQQEK